MTMVQGAREPPPLKPKTPDAYFDSLVNENLIAIARGLRERMKALAPHWSEALAWAFPAVRAMNASFPLWRRKPM